MDAGNEDGGKAGTASEREGERGREGEGMKEKQGELSSLHGHHLWAFFTAGEQMK